MISIDIMFGITTFHQQLDLLTNGNVPYKMYYITQSAFVCQ